ncbi:MAG: fumarate hydratase [Candidatus Saelkia tenebricola]|nr:fumarate hydratase [Candidatus Saelkia tenebricola]
MNLKEFRVLACDLYLEANFKIRSDIKRALIKAQKQEKNKLAKEALSVILENAKLAYRDKVAICQDTGYPVFFITVGGSFLKNMTGIKRELMAGIRDATFKGCLRSSIVKDPLKRKNISPNVPPVMHIECWDKNECEITLLVKGFGSENKSRLYLLNPNTKEDEIVDIIVKHIKEVGSSACPPYIIGIGIGGTADAALMLSKKATLINLDKKNKDSYLDKLEKRIEKGVNELKIGPLGMKGITTCLGVKIITHPTHIAGLPLAISVGCHATRSVNRKIKPKS